MKLFFFFCSSLLTVLFSIITPIKLTHPRSSRVSHYPSFINLEEFSLGSFLLRGSCPEHFLTFYFATLSDESVVRLFLHNLLQRDYPT